jgi:N-methylhydantoinase B
MTNTLNTPAEALELQYPLRVRRFERATGSGGAGQRRGGDGIIRAIEALAPCEGTLLADRRVTAPYAAGHAASGASGRDQIIGARKISQPLKGKAKFSLAKNDILSIQTPGGGGWDVGS